MQKVFFQLLEFYFHFDQEMPDELSGMIIGRDIYINKRKSLTTQLSTVAEEEGYEIFRPIHNMLMNIKDASVFEKAEQDLNRIE